VLIKVLTPGFYARSDTKTPLRLALWAMLVNLIGNFILIWPLAHIGVGVATALSAWVNVALLWFTLRKRGHVAVDDRLKRKAWRIVLAAVIMGVALYFGNELIEDQLGTGLWRRIAVLSSNTHARRFRHSANWQPSSGQLFGRNQKLGQNAG
jgi:putative peptidoglycan lipid II flippase